MKLDPTFDRDRPWLWMKFRAPEFDPSTGMDYEELKAQIMQRFGGNPDRLPSPVLRARAFTFIAENLRIEVDPHDFFPSFACWDRMDRPLTGLQYQLRDNVIEKLAHREMFNLLNASGSCRNWIDFDHSVPDYGFRITEIPRNSREPLVYAYCCDTGLFDGLAGIDPGKGLIRFQIVPDSRLYRSGRHPIIGSFTDDFSQF